MSNDTDEPPLALSNEAAQPVRDPQPESSIDTALGDTFTSSGRSNNITFVGKFHSAFRNYLEKNGLVTLDDFKHAEAIATIRGIEGTTPRLQDSWRRATNWKPKSALFMDDAVRTEGG